MGLLIALAVEEKEGMMGVTVIRGYGGVLLRGVQAAMVDGDHV